MKKVFLFIYPVLIAGLMIFSNTAYSQTYTHQIYKFGKVLDGINKFYVDSVDQENLVEKAIIEMLKELDPHSAYHTPEEVKEMNEPLQGNYEGIGISFNVLMDTILVISPITGGPSEKVGIIAGDRIVKIEGIVVAGIGITTTQVREKLLGEKGSKVQVSVLRQGENELLEFTITRDKIPIFSLDASYMINDETGYIRLNRFAFTTIKEFHEAVDKLRKKNLKHLILDLRDNGGGYLIESIKLADQFLKSKKLIVYTEGLKSPRSENFASSSGDFEEEGKVVVLINEGSASASEIVAGALQDWDRGIIIGRRSFGKALVQRPLNLADGSMVRLTIARYYTPTGRLIQKPYDKGYNEYSMELYNRSNNGELVDIEKINLPDSLKYYTLNNKREVYGGGGIMPDIFVPLDTSYYSDYYRDLIAKGIFNQFVLNYVDKNRKSFETKYPDFSKFKNNYKVNDKILEDLVDFAEKEKLDFESEEYNISKDHIKLLVKAYIARDLWSTSEFFEIINIKDNCFLKALEVLENSSLYSETITQ